MIRYLLLAALPALFLGCGGRSPLFIQDLVAVDDSAEGTLDPDDDDDDDDDEGGGNVGGSRTGSDGTRGGATVGVGGEAKGGASDVGGAGDGGAAPLSSIDYYVHPDGDDASPGTALLPFKTIEYAARLAIDGDTIWLQEGSYGWMSEPAFRDDVTITLAHGVALRAVRPGQVSLFSKVDVFGQGGLAFEGDAELSGLHLIGFNPALRADHGQLLLERVTFESPWTEGICAGGRHALIMLSGTAKMTMILDEAGAFRGYGKCLARTDDDAELSVRGGRVSGADWQYPLDPSAIFGAWGRSKLQLDGVTVRGNILTIVAAWDSSSVEISHSSMQGFALPDRAPPLMYVSDNATLTVESSWFDGADLQCCLCAASFGGHQLSGAKVLLKDVSMSHCRGAVALQNGSHVRLENVTLSDNDGALIMNGGDGKGSLELYDSRVASSAAHGMEIDAGSGELSFLMRNTTVAHNGGDGIRIGRTPGLGGVVSLDFGTVDDRGLNFMQDNGRSLAGSVHLRIRDDVAAQLWAVGNVWNASTQGSDSGGSYHPRSIDDNTYDADHQLVGANYAFEGENTASIVLRLAQRP